MITLQEIIIKLGLDSSGFTNGVKNAESTADKFGKTMLKALGVVSVGALAIKGFHDLSGVITDCVTAAIPLEGIQKSFDGLTASFEGGSKKMLQAMKDSTFGMVKQSDLMKSFNTAAQLVSKDFAQQLPDAMKYLSKVAASTGQDMGFMVDSLVKGVGRMSPMILDNLGIQVDLAMATQRAAEMYGVEAGELSKTQLQAGMMSVVLEKLEANTAAMPEVAGTAAQSFAALKTNVANLKEEIGMKLLPVFTAVTTGLSDWISSPAGQASIDKFIGWIEQVVGTAEPPTGLTGIVTYLMSGEIEKALEVAFGSEAATNIIAVSKAIESVGTALGEVITFYEPAKEGQRTLFNAMSEDWPKIVGYLNTAIETINLLRTNWGLTMDAISGWMTTFRTQMQSNINSVIGFINNLISAINSIPGISIPSMGTAPTAPITNLGQHAQGGSFTVPGSGSGDRPYTIGLTPGEQVSVTSKGESGLKEIDYERLAIIVRDAVLQVAQ